MNDELQWMDATAQAELVRKGEARPAELVAAAVERIERLNPALNAVIHTQFERAAALAAGSELGDGPFRGVPMLLKDAVCHEAGEPHHCGLRVMKDAGFREDRDTWLAERYRAAGFVNVGRTNVPELAATVTTEPLAYGPTHNPWDLGRSAGGSSGGSAAAVAAGMVPVAHGNDMGGSIRVPAANCGLVGLKPTKGRSTLGPELGEFWGPLTHQHVLTRSVRDSAAVLDATAGPGVGDPCAAAPPTRPWLEDVGRDPGRLRFGFRTALPDGSGSHPEVAAAVESAARLLEARGHEVTAEPLGALDDPALGEGIAVVYSAAIARSVAWWAARLGRPIEAGELEPMSAFLVEAGQAIPAVDYLAALDTLAIWSRRLQEAWQERIDVMVLPVLPDPPVPLGAFSPMAKEPMEMVLDLPRLTAFTMAFNVSGQPAVSLPLHWTADGLPVGVQLVAATGREDLLFAVAGQLEEDCPWAQRRPDHAG